MEAFLIPLLPPVALSLGLWAFVVWVSFRATGRGARRSAAAISAVLSICGAVAFLGFAGSDDYNDYPGYTCALRDGHVPDSFPSDRLPPEEQISTFHTNIDWSHGYELLPAGVRCTYWTRDEPRVSVVTHSPWSYSVWIYGLLAIALTQAVRVINPDLFARRRTKSS
ncbi:hypothetical protein G6009_13970 [Dietzia sp. SLG510A3-30A2]|nr:hypothetical protein [Dietzia sp. SLG510A3-30A2]